jgi:hypothetical protein
MNNTLRNILYIVITVIHVIVQLYVIALSEVNGIITMFALIVIEILTYSCLILLIKTKNYYYNTNDINIRKFLSYSFINIIITIILIIVIVI